MDTIFCHPLFESFARKFNLIDFRNLGFRQLVNLEEEAGRRYCFLLVEFRLCEVRVDLIKQSFLGNS